MNYRDKIAKLLAKAERTNNEHEKDAYTAQAERLMIKMGIDAAELEAAGTVQPDQIVEEQRVFKGNYSPNMISFIHQLSRSIGHLTVLQTKNYNGMERKGYVIGHKADVESFLILFDSLHLQVLAALRTWQKLPENRDRRRYQTDMQKFNENRSFIDGFASRVSRRIRDARREEEKVVTPGAALVLVGKDERIQEWVQGQYGDPKAARGGQRTGSSLGYTAGHAAGETARLGGTALPGSSKELS